MERTDRNIDEYIDSLPDEVRSDIRTLHGCIAQVMDGLPTSLYVGKFWGGSDQEIIGYGEQNYERSDKTKVRWFDVGLAVQKNHLSVYVNAVEDGKYLSEVHGKDLGKVKVGKSSLGFNSADDIDLTKLAELVGHARRILEEEE